MIKISIEEFAKNYIKENPGEKYKEIVELLKEARDRKLAGAKCPTCGKPMWVAGSAISGEDGCYTCLTDEKDSSEDYEVE